MEGKEIYYVPYFHWGSKFNAGYKAKNDVEIIFESAKFKRVDIFKKASDSNSRIFSLSRLISLYLKRNFANNAIVFFQNGTGLDLLIAPALRKAFKNAKRCIVIHDIESIRLARSIDFTREKLVFSNFTHAVCHSKKMADYIKEKLGYKGKIYILGLFDYILDTPVYERVMSKTLPSLGKYVISFAGNLSKSTFLKKIIKEVNPLNYTVYLYGKGYDGDTKDGVLEYKGVFHPDELPYKIEEHFGLVWDGEEVNGISGTVGHYLKYNSPHKASLYIVSGLPLIVWKESAIYETVKEYNIGFGVNSLKEIDEILSKVSEKDYQVWRENTIKLGKKLASGENVKEIINRILSE